MQKKERTKRIFSLLKEKYPDVKPQLNYKNPFELLIATILSAQCTDARVNMVTEKLFKVYNTPEKYLKLTEEQLGELIYSTGFYNQKAKSIIECCRKLKSDYSGKVPEDFNELVKLPGVGRKTASVVAGNAFGIPAIAVDTHVKRITNLLGLVTSKNPDIIELELKKIIPEQDWVASTHWFIMLGRNICVARKPKCSECFLAEYCPSNKG